MDKKNELIGDTLKKYRKEMGLSVPQVAAIMEQNYHMKVATKTIYGWESNQCYPPTQKMIALCEIYRISDLSSSFSQKKDTKNLMITPMERHVLLGYRENPLMRQAVCRLLGVEQYYLEELTAGSQK
jgi:transcriptional regulator with XRE-family HTH domain